MFNVICFIVTIISLLFAAYKAVEAKAYKTRLYRVHAAYHTAYGWLIAGEGCHYTMETLMATLNDCVHY